MKKSKSKKVKKQRAMHYEKPLKIYATFQQAIKAIVAEPEKKVK
jgi:hypothetical protein